MEKLGLGDMGSQMEKPQHWKLTMFIKYSRTRR